MLYLENAPPRFLLAFLLADKAVVVPHCLAGCEALICGTCDTRYTPHS